MINLFQSLSEGTSDSSKNQYLNLLLCSRSCVILWSKYHDAHHEYRITTPCCPQLLQFWSKAMRSMSAARRILQISAIWYLIMKIANENLIILSSTVAFVWFKRATAVEARWFQRELSAFIINYDLFKCKTNVWFFYAQQSSFL